MGSEIQIQPQGNDITVVSGGAHFNYVGIDGEVQKEVEIRASRIRYYAQQTVQNMILCGLELNHVKKALGHGLFGECAQAG